jgi:CspA family cold shock protein
LKPRNDRQRQPRRRGFDDDGFYGNTPPPPSFAGFGGGPSAPAVRATVKWYNPEKGFGFAEMSDGSGDVFLHASALQATGHQVVSPGATLEVVVRQGQKGREVGQVVSVDESSAAQPRPRETYGSRPSPQRSTRPQVDLSSAVEMVGTVKWYNPEKGFGFIAPQTGGKDIFVHATALERAGMTPLQEGQAVRVRVVQGAKGLEVGSISPPDS